VTAQSVDFVVVARSARCDVTGSPYSGRQAPHHGWRPGHFPVVTCTEIGSAALGLPCPPLVDPTVYRSRRPAQTPLYVMLDSLFETVERAWEDLFERRYGFCRGLLDGVVARYLDCGRRQRPPLSGGRPRTRQRAWPRRKGRARARQPLAWGPVPPRRPPPGRFGRLSPSPTLRSTLAEDESSYPLLSTPRPSTSSSPSRGRSAACPSSPGATAGGLSQSSPHASRRERQLPTNHVVPSGVSHVRPSTSRPMVRSRPEARP
jgi:hypothetical protein